MTTLRDRTMAIEREIEQIHAVRVELEDEIAKWKRTSVKRRVLRHEEDKLQISFVHWFDFHFPELSPLLFHPANGGKRGKIEAARFKQMGVRAGVADLIFLYPSKRYGCNALAIEFKYDKGRQSESQKVWAITAQKYHIRYVIIRGLSEGITEMENYLKIKEL